MFQMLNWFSNISLASGQNISMWKIQNGLSCIFNTVPTDILTTPRNQGMNNNSMTWISQNVLISVQEGLTNYILNTVKSYTDIP